MMNTKNLLISYFIDFNCNNVTETPNAFEYVMIPKSKTSNNSLYYELLLFDIIRYLSMNQCNGIQHSIPMLLQYEYYLLIPQHNKSYYKVPITSLCSPVYHSDSPISNGNSNDLFLLISKPLNHGLQCTSGSGGTTKSVGLMHSLDESSFRCNDNVLLNCVNIHRNGRNGHSGFDIYNPIQKPMHGASVSNIPKFASFHSSSGNEGHVHTQSQARPGTYRDREPQSHIPNDRVRPREVVPVPVTHDNRNPGSRGSQEQNKEQNKEEGLFSYATSIFNSASTLVESVATTGNSLISELVSTTGTMVSPVITLQNNNNVSIVKQLAEGGFSVVYLVAGDEISKPNTNNPNNNKSNKFSKQQQQKQQYYYALKRMRCTEEDSNKEAIKEINILNRFNNTNNKNIIQLLDYRIHKLPNISVKEYDLLFPLYSDGSAWNYIEKYMNFTQDRRDGQDTFGQDGLDGRDKYPFDECMALQIVYGVSNALMTVHTLGYTHRDLKPHNIMLKFLTSGPNSNSNRSNGTGTSSPRQLVCPILMDLGSVGPAKTNSPPISTKSQALDLESQTERHTA